ncbi:flagellar hook-associated protein 2 [Sphingomonas vulcanisoli]|uniref:Flagellar hook-associated protein 2 n=1 Tax=Sphingomonas vulcanisoli TaxID=1658060 RepID=A0ABX0TYW3_9SPHN|nr:flagellar filament capping protein FliD [Sphingomonas vulcanisoli]NIJ09590.1 flagellar hook-associated protein 2 [Sphingomonas vulcanisoli]
MTTTTATPSTTSPASTNSTTATTASAGAQILTALNAGSGVDTASLVTNLSAATYGDKQTSITNAQTTNSAQVSELATLSSALSTFKTSLNTLISGGTLRTQPSSSDTSVLTATAQAGASLGNLSAQLTVKQLAKAQSLVSGYLGTASTVIGAGGLTITVGSGSTAKTTQVTLDSSNDTLSGIASAINAANAGVTAAIVTDSTGARLQIKSTTGAANAFTIAPTSGSDTALGALQYPPITSTDGNGNTVTTGMTQAQAAQDAIVNLDGVDVSRSTNTISDLISGVTLSLVKAAPDETVSLGATRPTDAITAAVNDFVSAYNTLQSELATDTAYSTGSTSAGLFSGDSSVRMIMTQLSRLTSTTLNTSGGPSTLAEIGVQTGRDGTLSVDSTQLATMLSKYPDGVEALFNPTQHSSSALIKITSAMGAAKAGTYTLTNIVPANGSTPPSGSIGNLSGQPDGVLLAASPVADAAGLVIQPQGTVASATITVDPGIGGALQAIVDSLTASTGLLATISTRLQTQKSTLADQQTKLTSDKTNYETRLTSQFTAMNTAVSAYKSTQSYLTQQIAQWNKSS